MGYSCSAAAAKVMGAWTRECELATGSQNSYIESDGIVRFWERSNVEHDDGAVTGTVWKQAADGRCYRAGNFRIDGDGKIVRAPKWLRNRPIERNVMKRFIANAPIEHDHAHVMNRCLVDGKCCYER